MLRSWRRQSPPPSLRPSRTTGTSRCSPRPQRTREKRLELFGGNLLSELLFALVLGAACRAYGADLSLAELVFVNTSAGVLTGLIPIPGGIGAAEASTATGLIAIGVDESTAFAIALTKRVCTFYLPPLWGYPALQWLRRRVARVALCSSRLALNEPPAITRGSLKSDQVMTVGLPGVISRGSVMTSEVGPFLAMPGSEAGLQGDPRLVGSSFPGMAE